MLSAALPQHMLAQNVSVNLGNNDTDSVTVTVTVTVKMPKTVAVSQSADTIIAAIPKAIALPDTVAADTVILEAAIDTVNVTDAAGTQADMPVPGLPGALPEAQIIDRKRHPVVRKNTLPANRREMQERVIVRGDTVPMVIPTKNYGRYDRGLFNYLYIVPGSWQFGLSASYGEFNTDDVQVLSMLKDVDFNGKLYSIKPSVAYCFRSNQTMGLRLNYTRGKADLANLSVDIDDDMNFELHDVSYYSQTYSLGVFYRNYVGLNRNKRFAVFNEVSLDFSSGQSRFKRYYNEELSDTRTITRGASLNFSPGVCVFIQENAAFNVSFGVFGVKFNKESQTTNGIDEGSRFSSGANFKFNIFNINLGIMVVI